MSLLSYSGVTTKVRAMSGKLITESDYQEITTIGSVPEFVIFLKGLPSYEAIFSNIDVATLHRGDVEKLLTNSIYTDFSKIYRFSNVAQRGFLDLYFIKYQVSILKSCLRMVFDQQGYELDMDLFQTFFMRHSKLDVKKLSTSTSIDELIQNLKGSEFYEPLSKLLNIAHPTLFDYEIQLDLYYFSTFWNNRKKYLKGEDLEIITHSYGSIIDMLNIQWIYRCKKYYNMSNEDIYSFIIPINYRLKRHQLRDLIQAASEQEFENILNASHYTNTFCKLENLSLEDAYLLLTDKVHRDDSQKKPYTVAIINSYFYYKEREVNKLITILECIRYGYQASDIQNYLIKQ